VHLYAEVLKLEFIVLKSEKYMANKVKNIIIGCAGLILMACPPNTGDTTSSSSSSGVSSLSAGSNSQSETTVEQQVTTSGNPLVTETSDSENSSNTSGFDTIVMTISAIPLCGDGLQESPEECDDGNLIIEDSCDDYCFSTRFAFQSFESLPSNFGGVLEADTICQENANRAKLDGVYKAWVSDEFQFDSPLFRFASTDYKGWYLLPSNPPELLARGWEELTTIEIHHWIDIDAGGNESIITPEFAWTGTNVDGTFSEGNTCQGWTSSNGFETALVGSINDLFDGKWTNFQQEICTRNIERKIYCFQVI
jgi:cysteine-rich repeat protein